jgi:hypothetical protein
LEHAFLSANLLFHNNSRLILDVEVKLLSFSLIVTSLAPCLSGRAQPPEAQQIVVTGTLELRQAPPPADSFLRFFEKQVEAKKAEETATTQHSPFWNARFWSLLPRLESSSVDPSLFTVLDYATIEYREAARRMNELSRHSIFDN